MTTVLQVRKDALAATRLVRAEDRALRDGEVRVRIDSFALTANNITYAAFGDAMNYWQFFPTGEDGWGIVPVWGFVTVVQSLHPGVAVGERLWGYWPLGDGAILAPGRLSAEGFTDLAPHRKALHGVYNGYLRCNVDPYYSAGTEDVQALLRPLSATSWLIDDFLADNAFFGARTVLLSSASSKTAYGTAFVLKGREGIERIGLTSAANVAFCEGLGCYDRVLAYEQLDDVAADVPCVYLDFAGNADLRRRIHTRFADHLKYSCAIGGTHVQHLGGGGDLPGPRPTLFFAPAQIKKRQAEWGGEVLGQRLVEAWSRFRDEVSAPGSRWLAIEHHRGGEAVQAAYGRVHAGGGDPRTGHILTFAR
ncbi:DUF2855 family protein [Ramlibacter sp.]|uniref:DUF2855 family protein n=1 Tax=Ramlibacter sp. TaxID=1917967 RepID=UPI003D0FD756